MIDLQPVATDLAGRILTKNVVRGMVKDAIACGTWKMPSEDAITVLTSQMMKMQILNAVSPALEEHKGRVGEARHHLESFINILEGMHPADSAPQSHGHHSAERTRFETAVGRASGRREAARLAMISAATAWLDDPIFRTMAIEAPDLADWHTFAYVLAELFRACVATTNPKYLGYANGGPTPRFLAGAIPLISGETPSEGTIAAKLKAVVKAMKAGGADALAAGRQVAILTGNSDR